MFEFTVSDATCGHCAQAITTALKAVDEKATVEVDLRRRKVNVVSTQDRVTLETAIRGAGYTPS